MKKILDWLYDHPLINISGLEREADLPPLAIRRAIAGSRPLPEKHIKSIESVLKKYGYK